MQSSLSSSIEVQGANHEMYSKVRIAKIKCDMFMVVKKLSATLEKMQPCHTLRFARGASYNLKSHSTKSGRYPFSRLANTT